MLKSLTTKEFAAKLNKAGAISVEEGRILTRWYCNPDDSKIFFKAADFYHSGYKDIVIEAGEIEKIEYSTTSGDYFVYLKSDIPKQLRPSGPNMVFTLYALQRFDVDEDYSMSIQVEPIPPEDGGGFTAYVVGAEDTYVGDGESPAEALESLAGAIRFVDNLSKESN